METVKLYARDGGFVAEVRIPPLRPFAEGLMWGSRFFVFHAPCGDESGTYLRYREALLFYVLPTSDTSDSLTKLARETFAKATVAD